MIRKRYKKNLCLAAAALTLTASLGVGRAMAYFTTYATAAGGASLSLNNTVTIPEEDVVNWTKNVTIQNTGETDCYVRVQVFTGQPAVVRRTRKVDAGKRRVLLLQRYCTGGRSV